MSKASLSKLWLILKLLEFKWLLYLQSFLSPVLAIIPCRCPQIMCEAGLLPAMCNQVVLGGQVAGRGSIHVFPAAVNPCTLLSPMLWSKSWCWGTWSS